MNIFIKNHNIKLILIKFNHNIGKLFQHIQKHSKIS